MQLKFRDLAHANHYSVKKMSDLTRTQTVPWHRSCRNHTARKHARDSAISPFPPSSQAQARIHQVTRRVTAPKLPVGSEARKLTEDHPERDEGEQRQEAPRPPPRHPRRISPRAMPTRGADRCRRGVLRRLLSACPCRGISALSALPPPAEKSRRLRGSEVVVPIASWSALESCRVLECWVLSRVFTVSHVVTRD